MLTPLPLIGLAVGRSRAASHPRQSRSDAPARGAGDGRHRVCRRRASSAAWRSPATSTRPKCRPGYARTSFADFEPDEVELRGDHLVPPDVAALDGKKVFIKGYIRPDSTTRSPRQRQATSCWCATTTSAASAT